MNKISFMPKLFDTKCMQLVVDFSLDFKINKIQLHAFYVLSIQISVAWNQTNPFSCSHKHCVPFPPLTHRKAYTNSYTTAN